MTEPERAALTQRPSENWEQLSVVKEILENVRANGDAALLQYSEKFDRVRLERLEVSEREFAEAEDAVAAEVKRAIQTAASNIEAFHRLQIPRAVELETAPGVTCRREWRALEKVGLYVPGGSAPLFSTVLMLGIPARLAGCTQIVLCTPPSSSGKVAPEILFAAQVAGISTVFQVGGAQAIAAMAFGTQTIPSVYKIFGPGNRYVTAAKSLVSQPSYGTAIDVIAGPSELLIVADQRANPRWIAADLLTQAEHGPDSQVVLVATSPALVDLVEQELTLQLTDLPRQSITGTSLENSFALITAGIQESVHFANQYAPEHLILAVEGAQSLVPSIRNAGSVFIGPWSSVVFGDYASGTNHTLPTGGTARASGGLTVESFMKSITFQTLTRKGFESLAKTVEVLAHREGLDAHARAIAVRDPVGARSASLSVQNWIRPHLRNFQPYSSARSEAIEAEILLDANELTSGSPVTFDGVALNRYPDPSQEVLRKKLAQRLGVAVESVFVGNGSDEIIDLLLRLFCDPGRDSIAVLEPTYGVYRVAADSLEISTNTVELDGNFQLDPKAVPRFARMGFFCSPNNPTGNLLRREDILDLCRSFFGIVVVDEAYIEFSNGTSLTSAVQSFENLVVLRTLSKAWGLAGIRLGYCVANPLIVSYLMRIKAPYNVSAMSSVIALQALDREDFLEQSRNSIARERERLSAELANLPVVKQIYPSDANFLLVRFHNAEEAFAALLREGILVRRRTERRLQNCLRITVGTSAENDRVIGALRKIHEKSSVCRP